MSLNQAELEEQLGALKSAEDHAKKASVDASRLAEELRQEQEHSAQVEKARRSAEVLAKDLQTRLDEAEAAAMQGGRKIVQKMEQVYLFDQQFIHIGLVINCTNSMLIGARKSIGCAYVFYKYINSLF